MFTVKEIFCSDGDELGFSRVAEKFGARLRGYDRLFVLREDGEDKALGVLSLCDGKVVLGGVYGDVSDDYRDVMLRSLLHVCRCMENRITVWAESEDDRYIPFGFVKKDGGMEVENTDINFGHTIHG